MIVEPRIIKEGWDCIASVHFKHFRSSASVNASTVLLALKDGVKKVGKVSLCTHDYMATVCHL